MLYIERVQSRLEFSKNGKNRRKIYTLLRKLIRLEITLEMLVRSLANETGKGTKIHYFFIPHAKNLNFSTKSFHVLIKKIYTKKLLWNFSKQRFFQFLETWDSRLHLTFLSKKTNYFSYFAGIENVTAKLVGCCDYYFERKFVYIYCNVQPFLTTVHKIAWFRDVSEIKTIISNSYISYNRNSLVIPKLASSLISNRNQFTNRRRGLWVKILNYSDKLDIFANWASPNEKKILKSVSSENSNFPLKNTSCKFSKKDYPILAYFFEKK